MSGVLYTFQGCNMSINLGFDSKFPFHFLMWNAASFPQSMVQKKGFRKILLSKLLYLFLFVLLPGFSKNFHSWYCLSTYIYLPQQTILINLSAQEDMGVDPGCGFSSPKVGKTGHPEYLKFLWISSWWSGSFKHLPFDWEDWCKNLLLLRSTLMLLPEPCNASPHSSDSSWLYQRCP